MKKRLLVICHLLFLFVALGFTPVAAQQNGPVIDLTNNTDPGALMEAIASASSGSTIVLAKGAAYNISSTIDLDKSITIMSELNNNSNQAKIDFSYIFGFDITPGSSIDSLKFKDVNLRGSDFASHYVFNPNVSGNTTIGKILFESCNISNFRGVTRFRTSGSFVIDRLGFNKCLVDSIGNYGIVTIDTDADAKVNNIILRNSTFSNVEAVIVSKSKSESVVIENCTFYKAPRTGNYLVRYRNASSNTVANGIKIYNTILGPGWPRVGEELSPADVRGVQADAAVDVSNSYSTSDYVSTSNQITGLIPYSRESTYLFRDPENGNFTIVDMTFSGKNTAGDPRWRQNVTSLPQESQVTETIIYPNPFTAAATIAFAVKQQGQVSVMVTDLTGKQVVQLLNSRLTPGTHSVQWNGTDASGNNLTSGMYFVSIQMGDDRVVKRVALIRE